jgi:hypothetical protein
MGDAVMAGFGLPRAHQDEGLRAVRAALAMQVALEELNSQLASRYGVHLASRIFLAQQFGARLSVNVGEGRRRLHPHGVIRAAVSPGRGHGRREDCPHVVRLAVVSMRPTNSGI